MFVLVRAMVWATLFIAFLLVFLPVRILSNSGIARPAVLGPVELSGVALALVGALVAAWCILSFVVLGKGTPAPFDPPRRLVVRGPYRFVRNPMYVGAMLLLAGAAMLYRSIALLAYAGGFGLAMHAFVVLHEEPALRRMFGDDYERYCSRVRRWWPGRGSR